MMVPICCLAERGFWQPSKLGECEAYANPLVGSSSPHFELGNGSRLQICEKVSTYLFGSLKQSGIWDFMIVIILYRSVLHRIQLEDMANNVPYSLFLSHSSDDLFWLLTL